MSACNFSGVACEADKCQCEVDAMLAETSTLWAEYAPVAKALPVPCPMCRTCINQPMNAAGRAAHYKCGYCGMAYQTNEQGWLE